MENKPNFGHRGGAGPPGPPSVGNPVLAGENVKYWHLVMSNCFLPLAHLLSAQWAMNGVGTDEFKQKCKPHAEQRIHLLP